MNGNSRLILMEYLLFGLSEYSLLSRSKIEDGIQFRDMLSSMFTMPEAEDFEDEDDESQYKF
jgi:magnesium chelatase subunit I